MEKYSNLSEEQITAEELYQEAIRRHSDVWELARKKFPDYPNQVDQETNWIMENLSQIYPELKNNAYHAMVRTKVLEGMT